MYLHVMQLLTSAAMEIPNDCYHFDDKKCMWNINWSDPIQELLLLRIYAPCTHTFCVICTLIEFFWISKVHSSKTSVSLSLSQQRWEQFHNVVAQIGAHRVMFRIEWAWNIHLSHVDNSSITWSPTIVLGAGCWVNIWIQGSQVLYKSALIYIVVEIFICEVKLIHTSLPYICHWYNGYVGI